MSHTATIKTQFTDPAAIAAACQRMGIATAVSETVKMYDGKTYTGYALRLPDWHYPVVIDTKTGEIAYDDYNGQWGDRAHLDRFSQMYAVEKTKAEARRRGHSVTERTLSDGRIQLALRSR